MNVLFKVFDQRRKMFSTQENRWENTRSLDLDPQLDLKRNTIVVVTLKIFKIFDSNCCKVDQWAAASEISTNHAYIYPIKYLKNQKEFLKLQPRIFKFCQVVFIYKNQVYLMCFFDMNPVKNFIFLHKSADFFVLVNNFVKKFNIMLISLCTIIYNRN